MTSGIYSGDGHGLSRYIKSIYIGDEQGLARAVTAVYVGDEQNLARPAWVLDTELTLEYSGSYSDEVVEMADGIFRLLTLSGSGVLVFSRHVDCDIWACGGGGGGASTRQVFNSVFGGSGGGGGYTAYLQDQTVRRLTVSIGAGAPKTPAGPDNYNAENGAAGGDTQISGDVTLTAKGGGGALGYFRVNGAHVNGKGGDGGSGGGATANTTTVVSFPPGSGAGISTIPFFDAHFPPYCAGGGGGSTNHGWNGGAGGSNGADGGPKGGNGGSNIAAAGGYYGGGDGAVDQTDGHDATAWGGGGGGGATGPTGQQGGAGYQGCVMIRFPLPE